jgi:hypothetical protein
MRLGFAAALLSAIASPGFAHRLDEYLQNTIVSVEKHRLHAQIILTPGVAVFPMLVAQIDTDGNGEISEAEQRTYASRVLRDLSLAVDGERLRPREVSKRFPPMGDIREGRGEIQLDFEAELPPGGRNRKLSLENRHESRISAYQVNCLVPQDPHIRISAQHRNYTQSRYELEIEETDVREGAFFLSFLSGRLIWMGPIALVLLARLTVLCWQRQRAAAAIVR